MNKTLLLADDEEFILGAYKDGFERAGFTVLTAQNGVEVLELLAGEQLPDLILLDLIMPKVNGADALKAIKADPRLQHIPVVVLSNLSQNTDEAAILELGAMEFVIKSDFSLKDMIEKVNHILN